MLVLLVKFYWQKVWVSLHLILEEASSESRQEDGLEDQLDETFTLITTK